MADFAVFEAALGKAIDDGRIAGAVAHVVGPDGEVYLHAAGRRSVGGPEAMSTDSVFWIASMTKAIVSVAALQLVERGALALDDDLAGLLPDLARLEVLDGFQDGGAPRLRPAKGAVTLRHLLSHTSGLSYPFTSQALTDWMRATGAPDPASGSRAALRIPLLFDPGEGFVYGVGIDWAGLAIEAASGQRLDAYLNQNIFQPLGMTDTGFSPLEDRRAGVHARTPGGLASMAFGMPANPEVLSGGGGLYSTASDYGRFLRALLGGGALGDQRILSQNLAARLADIQPKTRPVELRSVNSTLSNDFMPYPGITPGHGLATMVTDRPTPEGRQPGALAWAGLANTYYWADPGAGLGGVLLTQLLPFADPDVLGLLAALERDAYAA